MLLRPLTPNEFLKRDYRVDLFLRKFENNDDFVLTCGKTVRFTYNHSVVEKMKSRNAKQLAEIKLKLEDGRQHRLSDLGKTSEFGGRGTGSSTKKEDKTLQSLLEQLNKIKMTTGNHNVDILVSGQIYSVYDFLSTSGTPKSDFHAVDSNGDEILWISHKDGFRPRDFQQWGGISEKLEPKIFNHPEVQKFVYDLKFEYPYGVPRSTTLYRKIKDNHLKMMSVYGNEYGGSLSRQNVSVLLQGPINLVNCNGYYTFKSNHVHYNGDSMDSCGFEPVLTAIYKGDRSDAGIKGTRIVIMPIEGRKMTSEI